MTREIGNIVVLSVESLMTQQSSLMCDFDLQKVCYYDPLLINHPLFHLLEGHKMDLFSMKTPAKTAG